MIYEFPDWAKVGARVKDADGNTWVIMDTYITGDYSSDWGELILEHAEIPGLEAEARVSSVEPVK